MAEESEDELEMLVEYDEEFSDSTTEDEGSEDDGELGEFEDGGDGEKRPKMMGKMRKMTTRNRQSYR